MIRTLQLAGVHSWVSLRLTVSRSYFLPRLTLALMAGYMLLFFACHFTPLGWGPVMVSFVTGATCISLARAEMTSRIVPVPLPQGWRTTVHILTQIVVCVLVAIGFLMVDVLTGYALAFSMHEGDWGALMSQPIPRMLDATEWQAMGLMVVASIPVGAAALSIGNYIQQPINNLGLRPWQTVLPPLVGVSAALMTGQWVAQEMGANVFVLNYLKAWLWFSLLITGVVTFSYVLSALFPLSDDRARVARPAQQRLVSTMGQSQAIKWSMFFFCILLYMVDIGAQLPPDWSSRLAIRSRSMLICYSVLLPLTSMIVLTGGRATVGGQQFVGSWDWSRSGWRMVPVPRHSVQRALLVDMVGFCTAATVLLHLAVLMMTGVTDGPLDMYAWVQDLSTYTWIFTWFCGITLPASVLFFIPRRRFGVGLTVVAIGATAWATRTALLGAGEDVGSTLPLNQHLITVGCWLVLAAAVWAQTASPSGRLFEPGSPAIRWMVAAGSFFAARSTRWTLGTAALAVTAAAIVVHQGAVGTELDRRHAARITAEQTDRLIEDLKRVAEIDVLRVTSRDRDAGSILNPHIGLDDGTSAQDVAWWDDAEHKYKFKRHPGAPLGRPWYVAPSTVDVEVGDLSILTELLAFDHWETGRLPAQDEASVGQYGAHLQTLRDRAYLNWVGPFPNLIAVLDLVKFRLLHGLRTNDLLPALREVRHLARLVYSDETLISTMVAIGILQNEQRVYAAAVEGGLLEPTDWVSVSEDDLYRMRRVALSLDYVMGGGADAAQWRRIADLPFEPFGLCGAIHESVTKAMSRPAVTPWPGERSTLPDMGFTEHAISTSRCRAPLARHDYAVLSGEASPDGLFWSQAWHRLLAKEVEESTMLKLTLPYLRGHAWMQIEEAQNMLGMLVYGDTAEDDWSGPRSPGAR